MCVLVGFATVDKLEVFYIDNYKDADYDSLNYYMSCINWDYKFSFVFKIEEYWDVFYKASYYCY